MSFRIAFTSCVRYADFPVQPWWDDIAAAKPDALVLLGDQIYMDYGPFGATKNGWPADCSAEHFRDTMNRRYEEQFSEPHFRALTDAMRSKGRLFAVWDDHDFAWNNACGLSMEEAFEGGVKRAFAREMFHHWMDCAPNPPEIYGAVDMGDVRLILLDNRGHASLPGHTSELLGETQWQFVEDQVHSATGYIVLCGGITLNKGTENWSRYPRELTRLHTLLGGRERVLFLAGDIHDNRFDRPGPGIPCYQAVASGLAINLTGIGFLPLTRHNWGMADLDPDGVTVTLVDKRRSTHYRISNHDWFGLAQPVKKANGPGWVLTPS